MSDEEPEEWVMPEMWIQAERIAEKISNSCGLSGKEKQRLKWMLVQDILKVTEEVLGWEEGRLMLGK